MENGARIPISNGVATKHDFVLASTLGAMEIF